MSLDPLTTILAQCTAINASTAAIQAQVAALQAAPAPPTAPSGSTGLSPFRIAGDDFTGYSGQTANLQKVITPNIGGTGGGTLLYTDGVAPQLASIDASVLYNGHPTMKYTQPGGGASTPELWAGLGSQTYTHLWLRAKIRFSPGFTTTGTLTNSANAYKLLGWAWANYYGSGRLEISNTNQYQLYWTALDKTTSATVGSGATVGIAGTITTEWTDGGWYDYIVEVNYAQPTGIVRLWMDKDGQTPVLRTTISGTMQNSLAMPALNQVMLGMNFNQVRTAGQTQALWYGQWEVIDGSAHPNPYSL
jgi:hypothetical protein